MGAAKVGAAKVAYAVNPVSAILLSFRQKMWHSVSEGIWN